MKSLMLSLLAVASLNLSSLSAAPMKKLVVKGQTRVEASPRQVLDRLYDYEAYCKRGCQFFIPSVKEQKILARNSRGYPSLVYIKVPGLRSVTTYNIVSHKVTSNGTVVFRSSYPTKTQQKRLRKKYGYKHKSPFENLEIEWKLSPLAFGRPAAAKTRVRHKTTISYTSGLIDTFKERVVRDISEARDTWFKHFRQYFQ